MRKYLLLVIGLGLGTGFAQADGWGRPDRRGSRIGSGNLILIPIEDAPVVAFRAVLSVGSIDDPAGKEGLCRLTMHAAAEGGTMLLSHAEVADLLYPMAASVDLSVDRETTIFTGLVRREDLDEFYPIFRDLVFHPRLADGDIEKVRDHSLSALRNDLRGRRDETLGKEALQAFLFEGTRLEHPPMGTEAGLESITPDDVRRFHREKIVLQSLWIGVAGGYDDGFVDRLREDLRAIPRRGEDRGARFDPAFPVSNGLELLLIEKPAPATAISIGFRHGVCRGHPDYFPLFLATTAFGEHRTFLGRLQQEMRSVRGLNYGDYAYLEHFEQDAWSRFPRQNLWRRIPYFSIWIRPVQPENGLFALRQAIWELRRLIEHGLTKEEFETTREHLRNVSQLWQQTLSRRLGMEIDDAYFREGDYLASLRSALDSMTREQVNAALRRNFTGEDLRAVLVCGKADSLRDLLRRGERTPIVYAGGKAPPEVLAKDEEILAMPLGLRRIEIVPAEEIFR